MERLHWCLDLMNAIRVRLHVADSSSAQTDSALRRPMTSMADELLSFEWLEANPTECAASSSSQGSAVTKPWESLALPDSAIGFQRDKGLYSHKADTHGYVRETDGPSLQMVQNWNACIDSCWTDPWTKLGTTTTYYLHSSYLFLRLILARRWIGRAGEVI